MVQLLAAIPKAQELLYQVVALFRAQPHSLLIDVLTYWCVGHMHTGRAFLLSG